MAFLNGDLDEERNCHQHIWRFRKSGTTEVVWWVATGSRNAGLAAG